jgi:hypothetical protein
VWWADEEKDLIATDRSKTVSVTLTGSTPPPSPADVDLNRQRTTHI